MELPTNPNLKRRSKGSSPKAGTNSEAKSSHLHHRNKSLVGRFPVKGKVMADNSGPSTHADKEIVVAPVGAADVMAPVTVAAGTVQQGKGKGKADEASPPPVGLSPGENDKEGTVKQVSVGLNPPKSKKSSGTMIGFGKYPQAEGRGVLTRIGKDSEGKEMMIDFWNDVLKLDIKKLEAVLSASVLEKEYSLTEFIRGIEYQGFDREFYIRTALSKMSVSVFSRFAVLGAVRGSNFKRITETCIMVPQDLVTAFGNLVFVKTPKKRDDLTILRCTASIPHWCAFYLIKAEVEKKLDSDCPACLQFPGAASLPMSRDVRIKHLNFCVAFSSLLPKGEFKLSIYMTAMSNLIPLSDIPIEVLQVLEVKSVAESYSLTDGDVDTYSKQVAVKR